MKRFLWIILTLLVALPANARQPRHQQQPAQQKQQAKPKATARAAVVPGGIAQGADGTIQVAGGGTLKAMTGTGLLKITSGVGSVATAGTDVSIPTNLGTNVTYTGSLNGSNFQVNGDGSFVAAGNLFAISNTGAMTTGSIPFTNLTSVPTTLAGYGITGAGTDYIAPNVFELRHSSSVTSYNSFLTCLAAAVPGDTIDCGPCNFDVGSGGIDGPTIPANVTIRGRGIGQSVITSSSNSNAQATLYLSSGVRLINLSVTNPIGKALCVQATGGVDDIRIDGCYLYGGVDTILASTSGKPITNCRVYNSLLYGGFDGMFWTIGSSGEFYNCDIFLNSLSNDPVNCFRPNTATILLKGCRVRSTQTNVGGATCTGITCQGSGASVIDAWDTQFIQTISDNTSGGNTLAALKPNAASIVTLHPGCTFSTTTAGSDTAYDVDNSAGGTVRVDPTTVGTNSGALLSTGTITKLANQLGTAAYTATSAYEVPLAFSTGLTRTTNTITVNSSQSIATLSNLTGNGFVKTGSGNGTLSIDTNSYLTATGAMSGGTIDNSVIGGSTPAAGHFTTIGASGQISSTLSTGTAPLSVNSTTVCSNLNAGFLNGASWASPNAIGATTPNTIDGSTITAHTKVNLVAASAPANNGDLANDSTQVGFGGKVNGLYGFLERCLFTQTASVTVSNTGTFTTLLGAGVPSSLPTLPANYFVAGKTIRIKAYGVYSMAAADATGVSLRFKIGASNVFTAALGAPATIAGSDITNQGWKAEIICTCRTTGSSGTVQAQGDFIAQTGGSTAPAYAAANKTGTNTVNTTGTLVLDVQSAFSAPTASDTITCTNVTVEEMN